MRKTDYCIDQVCDQDQRANSAAEPAFTEEEDRDQNCGQHPGHHEIADATGWHIHLADQSADGQHDQRIENIRANDIAERQEIPEPYLNQILTLLRKAGLIESRRGPGGGHVLARPAAEITLAELVAALEGAIWSPEEGLGQGSRTLILREVWQEVAEATERILARVSLADAVERERQRAYSYQI